MKVKPVRVEKFELSDLAVGMVFVLNGVQYIKIAESDERYDGVPAITLKQMCQFPVTTADNIASIRCRVTAGLVHSIQPDRQTDVLSYRIPNTLELKRYGALMRHRVNDCWYVESAAKDRLGGREYFKIDKEGNLCRCDTSSLKDPDMLGVRAICVIEPYAKVYAKL